MNSKRMKNKRLISALGGLLIAAAMTVGASAQPVADWFVDGATGDDNNGGTLWSIAFETPQKALEEAELAGGAQVIFVAAGTYYPDEINGGDSNLRSDSFDLVNGVAVYGGFLNGDVFEDRDPETNITILSGDIDQNDGPGQFENYDNNSYHVVIADGVGITTIINGFTVTAGNGDVSAPNRGAGAMWISMASPVVVRCRFVENQGDGIGAIYWPGGLMQGNPAAAVPAFMVNCEFIENQATGAAHRRGGGLHIDNGANVTLVNCTFIRNAANRGGGLFLAGVEQVTLINCTIAENIATAIGGGIYGLPALTVHNSILWGNTDNDSTTVEEEQLFSLGDAPTVTYTCIEGLIEHGQYDSGSNVFNIPYDPDFSPGIDNFRPNAGSPCIDTADNDEIPADVGDLNDDGNTTEETPYDLDLGDRVVDGDEDSIEDVDMGAYESVPCPADLDGDCVVGVKDLLILLGAWGTNPGHPADFDDSGDVGVPDLLFLLGTWGPCSCAPEAVVLSFEDVLTDACLTQQNWDEFEAVMGDATAGQAEKDNYLCWMSHYLEDCSRCSCAGALCPGPDPFR